MVINETALRLSSDFHPDRYVSESKKIQDLAQECFQLVVEAKDRLIEGENRSELKKRLDAESRGLQYVSSEDAKKAAAEAEEAREQAYKRASAAKAYGPAKAAAAIPSPYLSLKCFANAGFCNQATC